MEATLTTGRTKEIIKSSIFDILAVTMIYFVPAISHLFALPIYFIEPMRLMVILALVHTSNKNAYILAASLPIFSFLISAHPVLPKVMLITGELLFNVWLFFYLTEKFKNKFASMVLSITISKIAYYVVKFGLISFVLLEGSLISTPIIIQIITMLVFSGYVFLLKDKFNAGV